MSRNIRHYSEQLWGIVEAWVPVSRFSFVYMKYIFRQRKKLAVRWFVIINIEILPFECIFVNGFLKMAACLRSAETNCGSGSDENDVEVQFIDEDNLPLACITVLEHPESEEIVSDDLAQDTSEESESEEEESESDEEEDQSEWSEEINRRNDIDFNEFVGLSADVNPQIFDIK